MGDYAEGIVPQARIPDHRVAADTELLGQRDGGRVCERQLVASRLSRFGGFHAKYSCKIIVDIDLPYRCVLTSAKDLFISTGTEPAGKAA